MDWSELFNYLGAGGGLVVLLRWLSGLPAWYRRNKLAGNDTTRKIQESADQRIVELYEWRRYAEEKMAYMEGCITKLVSCPTYDKCPARVLVQDYKRKYFYRRTGQPPVEQKGVRLARDNPGESVTNECADGQPP